MVISNPGRLVRNLLAGTCLVTAVALLSGAVFAATPYTSETSFTTNMYWIADSYGGGTEFVPSSTTASLKGIEVYLANDGAAASHHVELLVQPTCSGPSSSALGTATVSVSGIPSGTYNPSRGWSVAGGGWITFQFSQQLSLTAGNTYCIVLSSPDIAKHLVIWAGTGTAPASAQPSWDYYGVAKGWKEIQGQYPAFQLLAAGSSATTSSSSAAASASSTAATSSTSASGQATKTLPKTGANPLVWMAGVALVFLGGVILRGLRARRA